MSAKKTVKAEGSDRHSNSAKTNYLFTIAATTESIVKQPSNILVIDVGGSHIKVLSSHAKESERFVSGPDMTAKQMVAGVKKIAKHWHYDAISIGYPGAVLHGKPAAEPFELGGGWVGFDFEKAFGCPVKIINDAAMQAMGSYEGGKMLFLGLGTGLGSTMIVDGFVEPLELGHLPYKKSTYEDYLGKRGLKRLGKKHWRKAFDKIVALLDKALEPDYIVIGGGDSKKLEGLPEDCRLGDNANAFTGGFRLWQNTGHTANAQKPQRPASKKGKQANENK